ncbi:hypothetical protein GCM10010446_67520 [Streptomyces enissocaesilis]|uniref:Transposase n=1 Tax=Streptomyces enissocaesilis TaxID=332589 RepID=A0ABN3XNW2_9ACTN
MLRWQISRAIKAWTLRKQGRPGDAPLKPKGARLDPRGSGGDSHRCQVTGQAGHWPPAQAGVTRHTT